MVPKKILKILPYFLLTLLPIIIYRRFFIEGLYPFPGNFLIAWFQPYKSYSVINGIISIPHKPIADDVFRHIYPFTTLAADLVKNLQLPLWNPYNGSGMPLLASLNNGLLDPSNVLYFLFSYPFAWSVQLILQSVFISICMYLYLRKIRSSVSASLFGSIAYTLSGFVTARVVFGVYGQAIAVLPLMLFVLESYSRTGSKKIFLLPFILFYLIVSSQPQISAYVMAFSVLYYLVIITGKQKAGRVLSGFILPGVLFLLGITLSAIQLLPTLELYRLGNITSENSLNIINRFLVPFNNVVKIFVPNYFGNAATYNFWGSGDYIQTITYVGMVPCLFAYLVLTKKTVLKTRLTLLLLITAVVSFLLAVDWPVARFITSLPIPILSTGAPSRIFFLTTFSLTTLSALGFDIFFAQKYSIKKLLKTVAPYLFIILLIVGMTFLLFLTKKACNNFIITACRTIALRNTLLETSVFVASFFLLILYLIFKERLRQVWIAGALLVLIASIGIYNTDKFLPFTSVQNIFPSNGLIKELQKQSATRQRILGLGDGTITTDFATQFRIYDPNYYHPLYIQRYKELIEFTNTGSMSPVLPRGDITINASLQATPAHKIRRDRLLQLLGIQNLLFLNSQLPDQSRPIWSDGTYTLIENEHPAPRVYVATKLYYQNAKEAALGTLFSQNFDPLDSAVIEEKISPRNFLSSGNINAKLVSYSANEVVINTEGDGKGLLILSDNYYPGWKAYIDGKETGVYRANYTFRGVLIGSGIHTVLFRYHPSSFFLGTKISLLSLFFIPVLYLLYNRSAKLSGKSITQDRR